MRNVLVIVGLMFLTACSKQVRKEATGFTQGTTYSVIYYNDGTDYQYQIDSLLLAFDRVLSTYQETSYISKWNKNMAVGLEQPDIFKEVVKRAKEVHAETDGRFDITVSPLMKYWFENNWKVTELDSSKVDSLMSFVGMHHIVLDGLNYIKTDSLTQLDVNAIAQGFSVDVLSRFLDSKDVFNYLVEIGGEIRASGTKPNQESWTVGIDRPLESNLERNLATSIKLNDRSLATSGNYRKFVEINGKKFGHTLDPRTGYPAKTDVLSATVIASDCMTADAYATACLVLGFEDAKKLINSTPQVDGVLIHGTDSILGVWFSDNVNQVTDELQN